MSAQTIAARGIWAFSCFRHNWFISGSDMAPIDRNINVYGRTGPFGDTLYFGLRDFKQTLLRRIGRRDEWIERAFRPGSPERPLLDALRQAREEWHEERHRLIEQSLQSWPGEDEPTSDTVTQRRSIIRNRLRQIEAYLGDVIDAAEQSSGKEWSPGTRLKRTLGGVLWPYYFIAYRPSDIALSSADDDTPNRKVTWLPPIEYLEENRRGARSLHSLLYPSLDRAVTGESDAIRRQLEAWLQIGEQPLPIGRDPTSDDSAQDGDYRSRDIGHVQRIRTHDRSATYEGDLLTSESRRDSRFADCVYANRSTFQIPIRQSGDDLSTEEGPLQGVLFLCAPFSLAEVFPSMREPRDSIWSTVCFDAWKASHGRVVGQRLRTQYQVLVDSLIQEVHRKTRRQSEQRSRRQRIQAYNGIAHSLGNAIDTSPDPNLELEQWCVEAAKGVISDHWTPEYVQWGPARDKLEAAFVDRTPSIRIDENEALREAADAVWVDPRLLAILTELCRNRSQNAPPTEDCAPISVVWTEDGRGSIEIRYEVPCYGKDFLTLTERLQNTKMSKWRGINFITQFAESIAPGESVTRWRFRRADDPSAEIASLPLTREQAGAGQLEAPSSLLERLDDESTLYDEPLTLSFWSHIPGAAARRPGPT